VENDDLKAIKTNSKAEPDVAKKIIPYTDSELKDIKKEAKNNPNLEARESTLLALLEGRQFEEYVGFKLRNRIILKKIWLKMSLRPSVVRKIINNEGLILDDVATVFGLTKERVRQIEAKVLRNISYHLVLP